MERPSYNVKYIKVKYIDVICLYHICLFMIIWFICFTTEREFHSRLCHIDGAFLMWVDFTFYDCKRICWASLTDKLRVLMITSLPQSHLGRVHRYPQVREWTLLLHVLAVACTMRNQALWNVVDHYGMLWHSYARYGTVTENIDFAHHYTHTTILQLSGLCPSLIEF